ncbi:hypothetical protein Agub_g11313 [Astrephomene gubernaculifera]|uniref:Uncharacterized protein n=1 Tax=Astrephomene gubernaculifera TaxID=47775 RepID=A0AAD3E0S5_9CHLO|nr:hypothetical protein Agub_g11313 [Astrephomene gubernaculifera]
MKRAYVTKTTGVDLAPATGFWGYSLLSPFAMFPEMAWTAAVVEPAAPAAAAPVKRHQKASAVGAARPAATVHTHYHVHGMLSQNYPMTTQPQQKDHLGFLLGHLLGQVAKLLACVHPQLSRPALNR